MSGYLYISIIIIITFIINIIIERFLLEIKDYFPEPELGHNWSVGVSNILSVLYYNIIIVAATTTTRTTQLFRFTENIRNFTENISGLLKCFKI